MYPIFNKKLFSLLFVSIVFFLGLTSHTFAAVSITTATGGTNISADKAANATSPAYTTLGNIVILETANNDINPNGTFTVQPPTGWQFNTTGVTTSVTGGLTAAVTSQTASLLTITIGGRNNGAIQSFTIVGLQVRATNGASLPSSGNITRAGGTAGVNGITNGTTNLGSLSQTFGAKNKLAFTTQPSATATFATNFTTPPVVKVQDQFGNTVTSDTVAVTHSAVFSNQVCGGTAGTGFITSTPVSGSNAVAGVLTYTAMQYSAIEAIKICATSGAVSTTSNTVTVGKADQAALTAIATPSSVTYGSTSTLSSSGGTGTGLVTFSHGASTGCSVSGTTLSVIDASGSCSITATKAADANYNATTSLPITVTLIPKSITVTASSSSKIFGNSDPLFTYTSSDTGVVFTGSLSRVAGEAVGVYEITIGDLSAGPNFSINFVSANFTIYPLPATKFVIASASNGTIDLPSYVVIQAQNGSNELVTSYQQDVTLVVSGSATGGGLVNIINGVGTTTISDEVIETVTLSLLDSELTGLNVSSTAEVSFGPGNTAKLSISASTTEMVAGTLLPVVISRYDRLDNAVTSGSETFYLSSNSLNLANKFYDASSGGNIITSVLISDSTSETTVWYYDEKVGAPEVTVSDNSGGPDGLVGVDDDSVTLDIISAQAATLLINNPGDLIAGNRLGYQVSRQDQFGNSSNNGSLTVYFYHDSSDSATDFYDTALGGSIIDSLIISPGATSSDFWFYVEKAGNVSVTVSDNSLTPDGAGGIADASDSIIVSPNSIGIFTLNDPGDMTVGTRAGYTVSRFDDYSNAVNSGDTTVYLYHDASGTSTVFYDAAVDGNEIDSLIISDTTYSSNFWLYSNDIGNYDVTVSDNSSSPDGSDGILDDMDNIIVTPEPIVATRFIILDDPLTAIVGDTVPIAVQAQDDSGNIDTTYNNSVTLHASGDATPGGIVSIINGVGSINIIDTKAEMVTLTLEDTAGTNLNVSSTKDITFLPGPTASFVMAGAVSSLAGERVAYTVSRKDQYDNQVTSGIDIVYLYSNSPVGTYNFFNTAVDGSQISSVSILDGSVSADVWFAGTTAGAWTLSASDNATNPDGVGIIDGVALLNISPNTTARLTLNDPGDMYNGTRLGYTATRFDTYENLVTAGSENYYLYSNSSGTSTAFYDMAIGGSVITELNFADGQSTANFWYYETTNGIWTVYLSDNSNAPDGLSGIADGEDGVIVSAVPIVATKFIIVVSTNSSTVGNPVVVDIRAVDNNNDIDTTYQNDVTLSASGVATGDGLIDIVNGVGQTSINDTVAETVNLSLQDTQSTGLNVFSTQSIIFSAAPVVSSGGGVVEINLIKPIVFFVGRAFPQANMEIMAIQNGQVPVSSASNVFSNGNFNTSFTGELPSAVDYFALVVYDKDQHIVQTKIFKLGVNDNLFASILLAPTIDLKQEVVTRGTFAGLTGSAMPNYKIELMIDGVKATESTVARADGNYDLVFNTYRLNLGEHTMRVRQVDNQGTASDYSIEKKFSIISSFTPKAV